MIGLVLGIFCFYVKIEISVRRLEYFYIDYIVVKVILVVNDVDFDVEFFEKIVVGDEMVVCEFMN